MAEKKNIVIVGGGGAGAPIARMLSEKLDISRYNLILVTARPYYTHLPAWVRMSVTDEGHLEDRAHITYNFNFHDGNGEFVIGKVASVHAEEGDKDGYILLESGQRVDYHVLILTPGSIREGPLDIPDNKAETLEWLKMWRNKFKDASDIVLVGGGAVSLEYAGEIKDVWPSKRVTIVHDKELLLNDAYPRYFRKQVQKGVEKRGVEVLLNDAVEDLTINGSTIVTKNGRRLVADLVVPCRGARPNTDFVTIDPVAISPTKHIKVSTTMQVRNYPRIFAAGDVIERDEQKQVSKYYAHAKVVAHNVIELLSGKQPSALYQGSYEMICLTNGKHGGSSYWSVFWGPTFGDLVSGTLKSKDLFLTWTRRSMGLRS